MIKRLIPLLIIICLSCVIAVVPVIAENEVSLYVDIENGADSNAGTIYNPLKTIEAAKNKVRELTKEQSSDITVYIREGIYDLDNTLCFDENDSGQNGFDVVYKAYNNEKAIISGGKRIDGWELHDKKLNIYRAPAKGIDTRGFSVNGKRAVRARSEDYPLSNVEKWSNKGITTTDTFMADWKNITDAEFVFQNVWFNSRCGINAVTKSGGKLQIEMDMPGWRYITTRTSYPCSEPEYIENAYELLDEPGEWYLNKEENVFYYIPLNGEDMDTAEAYAWVLETLVSVQGTSLDTPAHNIRFEDLSFRHATYLRPNSKSGHSDSQNNYVRNQEENSRDHLIEGAVEVEFANNIPFTGCEFTLVGALGLRFRNGVQYSDITGCHFHEIDGGGIAIGEGSTTMEYYTNPPDKRLYMKGNNIRNNYIHHVGRAFRSSSGISLGYVVDMEVAHNDIEYVPYCGMHIGYGWENDPSILQGLKVTNNYIQNVLYEKMYDGGGIYTNGRTSGSLGNMNIISENFIKDLYNDYAAIYQDNGSSYYRIERNVIDNYNYPTSPHNSPSRNWLLATSNGISLHYIDNYTVVSENQSARDKQLKATDMRLEGTKVVPDCMWDETALAIIAKAGIEPEWKKRLGGIDKTAIDKIIMPNEFELEIGQSVEIKPTLINNSGRVVSANMTYDIKNPEIVSVENGIIYGKAQGIAEVIINADSGNGNPKQKSVKVTVGDFATLVDVQPKITSIYEGNKVLLTATVETILGNSIEDAEVTYNTSDSSVATIVDGNYLSALKEGKCILEAKVRVNGDVFTEKINFNVVSLIKDKGIDGALRSAGMKADIVSLEKAIADTSHWYSPPSNGAVVVTPSDGSISVLTPGSSTSGYGMYTGKKYQNEILNFDMKINDTLNWYAIGLRNQSTNSPIAGGTDGTSAYVVVLNPGSVELHRFNDGARTVIYGQLENHTALAGGAVANKSCSFNEMHNMQFGAINTDEGVLLVLTSDGEVVFWYLDKSPDAITQPGYMSYIARKNSIEFSKPTKTDFDLNFDEATLDGTNSITYTDVADHWAINEITDLTKRGIFAGDDKNCFNPESQITRAEFLTALVRTMGIDKRAYRGAVRDIVGTEWYSCYVQAALESGFIPAAMLDAYDNLYPNNPLTREEAAGIISAALRLGDSDNNAESYSDYGEISDSYKAAFSNVAGEGIMSGQTQTHLAPKKSLTRAEAAAVIYRLVQKIN